MGITFDRDLLARLGLGDLADDDADDLLRFLHETLQSRVGLLIVERCTPEQLTEFEAAMEAGDAEASQWLDRHVADHVELVRSEFDALCAEVMAAAPRVLAELVHPSQSEDDVTVSDLPLGAGPTLVGEQGGTCLVVSSNARTVVAVSADRGDLCCRRSDDPPVVLRLPSRTQIEPTSVWCDDLGEVRVRAGEVDLCWQIPERAGPPVLEPEERSPLPRPELQWTDVAVRGRGFAEFSEGPWHVTDGNQIEVVNSDSGRRLSLEPLHDGPHSNAVQPHFTPDGRQLVAVHDARDEPTAGGLSACSVEYLAGVEVPDTPGDDDAEPVLVRWQHTVRPNASVVDDEVSSVATEDLFVDAIGYDPSARRAALADGRSVHLFDTSDWSTVGVLRRPDRSALTFRIPVPGDDAPLLCWAGRSLVAAAGDGTLWRLDPSGSVGPERLMTPATDRSPVSVVGLGDRAVLVHADRSVVSVDADGAVTVEQLPGTEPLVAADATADGRLLVADRSGLELWSGGVLHAKVRLTGPEVVGVVSCGRMAEWSLLWRADGSIASARATGRRIRLTPGRVPHQPGEGFTPSALTGLMVDVDQWFLVQERTSDDGTTTTVVAAPDGWVDVAALCLTSSHAASWVAAGTQQGIDFIPTTAQRAPTPRSIDLGAPVTSIAAGPDERSLAAGTPGAIWMARLLT